MRLFKSLSLSILIFILSCSTFSKENREIRKQRSNPIHLAAKHAVDFAKPLHERIGGESAIILRYLRDLDGRSDYQFYHPTAREKGEVMRTIARLPLLLRTNLDKNVIGIYFIKNFASSGLTDWVRDENGKLFSFVVLSEAVFRKTVSELLTAREMTCFKRDGSGISVRIDAGNDPALDYILLHEAVHAADYSLRISPFVERVSELAQRIQEKRYSVVDLYWQDDRTPSFDYDFELRDKVSFYGFRNGPHLNLSDAVGIYRSLSKSPFISLYASQYRAEDLADLVAMYHLGIRLKRNYTISLFQNGKLLSRYFPLTFKDVRERFEDILFFYSGY